jgi:hypothetical protein
VSVPSWLNRDFWGPVWPNLVASVLWAAPAFTAHHVLMRRHTTREIDRQTVEIKAHLEGAGQR